MPANQDRQSRLATRIVGLLAVWLLACLGVLCAALPAHAATGGLLTSDPGGGEQLDRAPGWVNLAFDHTVDDRVAKVLVLDAKGDNVTAGPLIVEATNVTTQLEDGLAKGTYTVHYRVDGQDGEPRGGAFQFSYGTGTFSDPPDRSWSGGSNEPVILRGDNPNGPEESGPPETGSPSVEVTSSEKPDRASQVPTATTDPNDPDDPDDPDDPASSRAGAAEDPSSSQTTSAAPVDPGVGRAFLVGGIVLLVAAAGAGFGLYRSSRSGTHS